MMPYHKFPEDKVMLSGASWEKTAAGRRYNPLNYPLKMPRQKKLKAQLEIPFTQASLLWREALAGLWARKGTRRECPNLSPAKTEKMELIFPRLLISRIPFQQQ